MKRPENWKRYVAVVLFLLVSYLIAGSFAVFILVGLLDGLKSLLMKQYGLNLVGFELSTFSAVIAALHTGPLAGAAAGITVCTLAHLVSGSFGIYLMWKIPGAALVGITTALFLQDLARIAYLIPFTLRPVYILFTMRFAPSYLGATFFYEITSALSSYLLIKELGPLALTLLSNV